MKHTPSRTALAILACLALLFAGAATVTPAGATWQDRAVAVAKQNWNKVWKQQIRPKADRRYYTKNKANKRFTTQAQSDAKYAGKGEAYTKPQSDANYAGKGEAYTKPQSDAKYATKGEAYTKAETDAKYAGQRTVFRGSYLGGGANPGAGGFVFGDLSFGVTLSAAPAAHYIEQGDPVPAGCLGTAEAPDAAPGHLCVFETDALGVAANRHVTDGAFSPDTATPVGAWLYASTSGASSYSYFGGTWVLRAGPGVSVLAAAKVPSMGTAQGAPR